MPYLIDGHNLIPKIPTLSLSYIDDEIQLIEMLQVFCQRKQKKVEVYFDHAPPGQPKVRSYSSVIAHFIREQTTADSAIRYRLNLLGKQARNWTVVSSDHSVQLFARSARAKVLSSEEFASLLINVLHENPKPSKPDQPSPINDAEIAEWLTMFRKPSKDD
jgi:predicted RNA-binding protein with PIN domain